MKKAKQNIIAKIKGSTIINKYVFVVFALHFILAHLMLGNYIICIENGGKFSIKNSFNSKICCNLSLSTQYNVGETELNDDLECEFCSDISIYENCDEQYSRNIKKINTPIHSFTIVSNEQFGNIQKEIKYFNKVPQNFKSPQLDSHKTVLLLI